MLLDLSFGGWIMKKESKKLPRIFESLSLLLFLVGCGAIGSDEMIKMTNDSQYYMDEDWESEIVEQHFEELGFIDVARIETKPNQHNYKNNLADITITLDRDGESEEISSWNVGDEFPANSPIKIWFLSSEFMTTENSQDLQAIVNDGSLSYKYFCEKYDKEDVAFEAIVTEHIVFMGGTSHIINVTGLEGCGLSIRIDEAIFADIDYDVQPGDKVFVFGQVDKDDSQYFNQMCISTELLCKI